MDADKIYKHITHFTGMANKPPEDKLITVFCNDGGSEVGFVHNTFFQDLGITMLIVEKWILQEDLDKLLAKSND